MSKIKYIIGVLLICLCLSTPAFALDPSAYSSLGNALIQNNAGYQYNVGSVSYVACQSAVSTGVLGTTSAVTLATCTIPAGSLGLNGSVSIQAAWAMPSAANNKTAAISFGGTSLHSTVGTTITSVATSDIVWNTNLATAQYASFNTITSGATLVAGATVPAINSANAVAITFIGTSTAETTVAQTALTGNGATCNATVASGAYAIGDWIYVTTGTGCGSGTQNSGSTTAAVQVTASNGSTTYSYPCTCNAGTAISGTGYRISQITLKGYTVVVYPGAN